jgi:hypothetical protein
MSQTYLTDLLYAGTVCGHPATPQDLADAYRACCDYAVQSAANDDPLGLALARLALRDLAARQLKPVLRSGAFVRMAASRAASAPELPAAERVLVTDLASVPY